MMILVDGQTNLETKITSKTGLLGRINGSEYTSSDVNVSGTINRF